MHPLTHTSSSPAKQTLKARVQGDGLCRNGAGDDPKITSSVKNKGENPLLKSVLQLPQFCLPVTASLRRGQQKGQAREEVVRLSLNCRPFLLGLQGLPAGEALLQ